MKINSSTFKVNSWFTLVIIIYSISGMFLLRYYQYQVNPDALSYISLAQKYLIGDFSNAINGMWSPLFSWLLIPFLYFGLKPLLATKVLSLIIGLFAIIGVKLLSYKFEMAERNRNIIMFSLIPIILYFSFSVITPDLLSVCFLIYYLNIIFSSQYCDKVQKGIFCGALGAVAYLSQPYGFPFFISHFLLFNTFHYHRCATKAKRKTVLRNLLFGFIIFFIISGVWITIISNKYHEITIGTAAKQNYAFVGPEPQVLHILCHGFLKPPNETAVSIWEDPSYLEMKPWSSIQSWKSFRHQIKLIFKNSKTIIIIFQSFSLLAVSIIIIYMLFYIIPFNKIILQGNILYPLVTIILYSAGYTLFRVEERWLWIIDILLILMGGHILSRLFQNDFFNNIRTKIALMFFILSFIAMPFKRLVQDINTGKDMYNLTKILRGYNIQDSNIASNTNWNTALYLSYYLNCKYFGIPKKNISDENLETELKKNKIDYYFVWDKSVYCSSKFLDSNYKEITKGELPGLEIYSLK